MSRWELLAKLNPHLEPPISEGLAIAKKYYMRMDRSPAYIISMCEYHIISYYLCLIYL
jgi:hypothetical protein